MPSPYITEREQVQDDKVGLKRKAENGKRKTVRGEREADERMNLKLETSFSPPPAPINPIDSIDSIVPIVPLAPLPSSSPKNSFPQ